MYSIKETPTILSTPFALSDAIVSAHLAFVSFCKAINWSIYESKECVEQRRPFSLEAIMRLQHRDETTTLIIICLALYRSNFNRFRTIDTTCFRVFNSLIDPAPSRIFWSLYISYKEIVSRLSQFPTYHPTHIRNLSESTSMCQTFDR